MVEKAGSISRTAPVVSPGQRDPEPIPKRSETVIPLPGFDRILLDFVLDLQIFRNCDSPFPASARGSAPLHGALATKTTM